MSAAPDHTLPLTGGWTVWREVELRSAGFSADRIEGLAEPELARRIDAWLAAEAEAEAAARAESEKRTAEPRAKRPRLRPPAKPTAELVAAMELAQGRASDRLRELALDPRFREAVMWQNRRALERGVGSLLRRPVGTRANSKDRQNEQLVASYAQRYCCKNERIGFFGASAPARLVEGGRALSVREGPELISRRSTYLEPWAIDALADALAADPELRPLLRPRLLPTLRLDEEHLIHPDGRRTRLPPAVARLLAACDGVRTARQIIEQLVDEASSKDERREWLEELAAERAIVWTLEVPTCGDAPERLLHAALDRLPDAEARTRARAALTALERARDGVALAAGDLPRLEAALDRMDRTFVELTRQDSTRNSGETYAGRTLLGEDCVRDVEVEIGPAVLERLAGPLELVLLGARWYTHEIASRYRAAIRQEYEALRGDGPAAIDYARFHLRLPALFPARPEAGATDGSIVARVADELRRRWRELLGVTGDERRLERRAAELRPQVAQAFAAPGPGWPAARHHSPDVLLAAADAEAVQRGEFLAVLGELHAGMSSLLIPAVPNSQRDPDAPFLLRDRDLGVAGIAPVWSRRRSRLDYYSRSRGDYDLESSSALSWRPRAQVLALSELVMEELDGALVVRTRDRRVSFDVIAFLEHHLLAASFSQLSLLGGDHVPRVTVDGVVLTRERWTVPAAQLAFAREEDTTARFVAARAWARAAGLPRRLFLKVPEETKPLFLDLESPTFVDLAAKMVRKASEISLSEMLPDLEGLWLTDAQGKRYTSELRLVAVDPVAWCAG